MTGRRNIFSRAASDGMIGLVRAYQLGLSPWFGHACRFQPTCSSYAIEAIRHHGPAKGGALAAWRIARCNPFGGSGYDPVPSLLNAQAKENADDPHHPA
ncbi:membrane protein insertion efficiency factor YidD (plasmid) [Paracoccus yeei]|jgi:hypothetical protein